MKKQTLTYLLGLALFCQNLTAQHTHDHRNCSTETVHQLYMADDEDYRDRREAIERHTQNYVRNTPSVNQRSVITIPVVVHVLYNNDAQNISEAQIMSQIAVLNQDFRRNNLDKNLTPTEFTTVAADCEIEFCLARRKPDGTTTNGIERLYTTKTAWAANDDMKRATKGGLDSWDGTRYLNIWVCALQGQLGYASFPGAPINTDGVVIDYRYFGTMNTRSPFHLGRTTTHEVGHWLNLYHVWGDSACGEDYCNDTPVQQGANYGCPTHPHVRTGCSRLTNEMFMNFMDYTNDACMNLFTRNQKSRMLALFAVGGARRGIAESSACVAPLPICTAPTNVQVFNIQTNVATVSWTAANNAFGYTLEYKKVSDAAWTPLSNLAVNTFTINNLAQSTDYQIRLKTICNNSTESTTTAVFSFRTNAPIIIEPKLCNDVFEPNNTRLVAKSISANRITEGGISDARDRDWYSLSNLRVGSQLRLRLSNLPADYDLRLFDANGLLIGSSESMGRTDEEIRLFVQASQTTVYAMVYGYNGAFSQKQCYTLTPTVILSNRFALDEDKPVAVTATSAQLKTQNSKLKTAHTEGVKIYPNPTSGSLQIELENTYEGRANILIFNSLGQVVQTEQTWISENKGFLKLDVSALQTGFYLLKIEQDGDTWVKKFYKKE
jgi:hypothetical protein